MHKTQQPTPRKRGRENKAIQVLYFFLTELDKELVRSDKNGETLLQLTNSLKSIFLLSPGFCYRYD